MRILRKVGVVAIVGLSWVGVTAATIGNADAGQNKRGWRGGYLSGTAVVSGLALGTSATTRRYYGNRYAFPSWDYAPGGPFVDYPYCGLGSRPC